MVSAPEYCVHTHAKLVHALCLLHNYIQVYDPDDFDEDDIESSQQTNPVPGASMFGGDITSEEHQEAADHRDRIAKEIWDSYVDYVATNTQ